MYKQPSQGPSLVLLFVMMLSSQMALTIFLPAVVNMSEGLNTPLTTVQLVIPAYLCAFAIMQLVAGPLSDAFGRRPIILCGVGLFTLASIACGMSNNIEQLLLSRFFQAMGACQRWFRLENRCSNSFLSSNGLSSGSCYRTLIRRVSGILV